MTCGAGAWHPAVDTLVNNVGIFFGKLFTEYAEADFVRKISVAVMEGRAALRG